MRRTHLPTVLAFTAVLVLGVVGNAGATEPVSQEYRYRWHLGSLLGRVAGLFLPSHGDGVLRVTGDGGRMTSELLITSEESDAGEYWRYGSEMDPETGLAVRAWSSYKWRGEEKSKEAEIDSDDGVRDVVSGIWAIRQDPPEQPRKMEIWSDGKIYPVMVVPRGAETRTVDGKKVATRHFTITGYDVPGKRRWKGTLELWLAEDEAATPVEIHISRSLADLRLELQTP